MTGTAVMIHGAGGGGWEWRVWSRVLASRGWRVVAPDLMPTVAGLAATRFDDYRAQVRASLEACGDARIALIGASLGGLLAACAADHPRVASLVLVNAMPPSPWHVDLPPMRERGDIIPWGRDASLAGTRRALPDADEPTCLFAARHWRDESAAVLRDARAGVAVDMPRSPVLMLASSNDDDVPPAIMHAWARAWRASIVTCRDASHVGPLLGRAAASHARFVHEWLSTTGAIGGT